MKLNFQIIYVLLRTFLDLPMNSSHRVFLVGAGPGDPDLISVKGLKAVMKADVILYDALVDTRLLENAKPSCKVVYVGKRKGKRAFSQDEINSLIVFYSTRYQTVVRLKGGDPFVFGRGHEEVEYAQRRGIEVEIVPGISSALAAPSAAGIPLTKRGVNESFWVVTGTTSSGETGNDLQHAARSSATIIVLMGISHLEAIVATIIAERSAEEPMAIVQHATCASQKEFIGTAGDILFKISKESVITPAVIVIGKVVNERNMPEAIYSYVDQNNFKQLRYDPTYPGYNAL